MRVEGFARLLFVKHFISVGRGDALLCGFVCDRKMSPPKKVSAQNVVKIGAFPNATPTSKMLKNLSMRTKKVKDAVVPTYPIEQNRTKNQSNPIERLEFGNWTKWIGVRQSNKIEHLNFAVSSIFKPIEPI